MLIRIAEKFKGPKNKGRKINVSSHPKPPKIIPGMSSTIQTDQSPPEQVSLVQTRSGQIKTICSMRNIAVQINTPTIFCQIIQSIFPLAQMGVLAPASPPSTPAEIVFFTTSLIFFV
jgi:hypothetical protein